MAHHHCAGFVRQPNTTDDHNYNAIKSSFCILGAFYRTASQSADHRPSKLRDFTSPKLSKLHSPLTLPAAVIDINRFWKARCNGALPVTRQAVSGSTAKVGRNDPCPCGSGKKYKRCC